MEHAGFPNGLNITVEEVEDQLATQSDDTKLLIIEKNGRSIGEMNYSNLGNNMAEIGIKICDPHYQNSGIGPTLLSLLIKELFSLGYTKIVLDTNLKNERAQHVYEKLGFKKTGERLNSWKNQLGEYQSAVNYELLPEEFISNIM